MKKINIYFKLIILITCLGLMYACEKPEEDTAGVFPADFQGAGSIGDTTSTAK